MVTTQKSHKAHRKWMQYALDEACNNKYIKKRHGAAVVFRNQLLCTAQNYYTPNVDSGRIIESKCSIHAETQAILKAHSRLMAQGKRPKGKKVHVTLYVARVVCEETFREAVVENKENESNTQHGQQTVLPCSPKEKSFQAACSKPCRLCSHLLSKCKWVSRIVYTDT